MLVCAHECLELHGRILKHAKDLNMSKCVWYIYQKGHVQVDISQIIQIGIHWKDEQLLKQCVEDGFSPNKLLYEAMSQCKSKSIHIAICLGADDYRNILKWAVVHDCYPLIQDILKIAGYTPNDVLKIAVKKFLPKLIIWSLDNGADDYMFIFKWLTTNKQLSESIRNIIQHSCQPKK